MARNLVSRLRKWRASPMAQHDRLPPELRAWLAQAALPWSAHSALKLWHRALREAGGDTSAAKAALTRAEARMIARDAALVWGADHPAACAPLTPQRRNRTSSSALM